MLSNASLILIIVVSILFVILSSAKWKLHPFLGLLVASLFVGIASGLSYDVVLKAINNGFGLILGYIGMVIVIGSIIGVFIEKTGATLTIADTIIKVVGEKRPAIAMSLIGAVVSIPVFCDSAFIILSRLNKALADKANYSQAVIALSLATGLYTTHTLVPPTPGPIAAAANIGASDYLGTIILIGIVVSIPVLAISNYLSRRFGQSIVIKLTDIDIIEPDKKSHAAVLAFLPIVLPILLIAFATTGKFFNLEGSIIEFLFFIGHPLIALLIGLLCCLFLLRPGDRKDTLNWTVDAIKLAGPILILTGAGGAFGNVLKSTQLGDMLKSWLESSPSSGMFILLICFGIAALLKTAQGSSTSSLVITSSIMAPILVSSGIDGPIEMALIVMAIGGGAMTISHANDSYFWVVSQFSNIKMKDSFRSYSIITGVQGFTVLLMSLILYLILV